jgi:hypothetical protein
MTGTDITEAERTHWNRWQGLSRRAALAVLTLLAALILFGLIDPATVEVPRVAPAGPGAMQAQGMTGDHALYANVAKRVAAGENYYAAAAAEHRANSYPLKPFVTVRLPTLAYGFAWLGPTGGLVLVAAIGVAAILVWRRRLMHEAALPPYARFGALFMAANLSPILSPEWVLIHELAAGALIALALALYRPERPWAALAVLLAAALIRETVLPAAMLLGCFAMFDRDWRAVAAWLAFGLGLLAVLILHMQAVDAVLRPGDLASPGWDGMGGWHAYLAFVHHVSAFRFLPVGAVAVLVPLALLGWAAWRSRTAHAMLAVQLIFAAVLMLFARPNNFYWALLVVPTLFTGLIFVPAALAGLVRSVQRRPQPA